MHEKDFIVEIISDTIKSINNKTADEIASIIYEALTNELEIYVLTKDCVGKLT